MNSRSCPLAVITGASSGIGLELARLCAATGFDLVIAADEERIQDAAAELAARGADCVALQCDLATREGTDRLLGAIDSTGRAVDALLANAGRGLGRAFLDLNVADALRVVHTDIDGTLRLIQPIARQMRDRQQGRILVTGSMGGLLPGFEAVYRGTGAFLDSFVVALRSELEGCGVTLTYLMPGPTETAFFDRAHMADTKIGRQEKADAAEVARAGFDAMMNGEPQVVAGFGSGVRAVMAHILTDSAFAKTDEPGQTTAGDEGESMRPARRRKVIPKRQR